MRKDGWEDKGGRERSRAEDLMKLPRSTETSRLKGRDADTRGRAGGSIDMVRDRESCRVCGELL